MSLMHSTSLFCNHCRRWEAARVDRKVRGEPDGSRFKTGASDLEMEVVWEGDSRWEFSMEG
jgi:hypothetical protein